MSQKPEKAQKMSRASYLLGIDLEQLRSHKDAAGAALDLEPHSNKIAEMLSGGIPAVTILKTVCARLGISHHVAARAIQICLNGTGIEFKLPRGHRPRKSELGDDLRQAASPAPPAETQGAKKGVGDAPPASAAPAPVAVAPQPPAQPAPTPAPTSSQRRLTPGEMLLIDAEVEGDSVHLDEYHYKQLARFETGIAVFLEGTESERKRMIQTVFADGHRSVPYPRENVNGMLRGMMPDIRRNAEKVWASRPPGKPPGDQPNAPT
jgi:hypothetical protein